MKSKILTIDQGTTSTRALIVDADLNVLASDEREFVRFCAGLEEVGLQLLDHLADRFLHHAGASAEDVAAEAWIFQTRAGSLIAWIAQLAQVHGVAFGDPVARISAQAQAVLNGLTDRLAARVAEKMTSFSYRSSGGV